MSIKIDSLVAEKVMGWIKAPETSVLKSMWVVPPMGNVYPKLPNFSTDIKAAWMVVEKLRADGYYFCLDEGDRGEYCCIFANPNVYRAEEETAPLSICLAALEAVGIERS